MAEQLVSDELWGLIEPLLPPPRPRPKGGRRPVPHRAALDFSGFRPYVSSMDYEKYITIEPGKRGGKPCIRGLRITVWDVLNWLAAGITGQQILDGYRELESDDFRAVCEFAAKIGRRVAL